MTNTTEHPHAPEPHAEVGQVQRPVRPDPERAAFEAWLNPGRHAGNVSAWVEPGRYEKDTHQLAWLAWRAARERIDELLRTHQDVSLDTLEYLETMRLGPTREEWAELDARARGDGEPGCRDCADNNGTCPHDGHKCGA